MIYVFQGVKGYLTLLILMILEGLGLPIPSEVIMPLVGYYAYYKEIDLYVGILIGTLGSLIGSIIAYFVGLKMGLPFLKKYGKYFLIDEKKIEAIHKWFLKYGEVSVFGFRFVPELRALISYPAGVAQMRVLKFLTFTFLGHTIWDFTLSFLGYSYANQINAIVTEAEKFGEYTVVIITFLIVIYVVRKLIKKRS